MADLVINTADLGLEPRSAWVTIRTCDVDGEPVDDVTSGGQVIVNPKRARTGHDGTTTMTLVPTADLDQPGTFYLAEVGAFSKVFEKGTGSENLADLATPISPVPRDPALELDGLDDVDSPTADREDGQVLTWDTGTGKASFEDPTGGGGTVTSVVAGAGVTVDSSTPSAPVVTAEVTQTELDAKASAVALAAHLAELVIEADSGGAHSSTAIVVDLDSSMGTRLGDPPQPVTNALDFLLVTADYLVTVDAALGQALDDELIARQDGDAAITASIPGIVDERIEAQTQPIDELDEAPADITTQVVVGRGAADPERLSLPGLARQIAGSSLEQTLVDGVTLDVVNYFGAGYDGGSNISIVLPHIDAALLPYGRTMLTQTGAGTITVTVGSDALIIGPKVSTWGPGTRLMVEARVESGGDTVWCVTPLGLAGTSYGWSLLQLADVAALRTSLGSLDQFVAPVGILPWGGLTIGGTGGATEGAVLIGANAVTKGILAMYGDVTNLVTEKARIQMIATATPSIMFGPGGVTTPVTGISYVSAGVLSLGSTLLRSTTNPSGNDDLVRKAWITPPVIKRTVAIAYASAITPNSTTTDTANVATLTNTITINAPSGSPVDGQELTLRFTQDATGRAITWNAIYAFGTDITAAMVPTTASAKFEITFRYNTADTKWRAVALVRGF